MARLIALLVTVLVLAPVARARAGETHTICGAPSVIDLMSRELRKRDYYARIDPRLTEEFPQSAANTVVCGVAVRTLTHNPPLAGDLPLGLCEAHAFQVRALSNGFVVLYLQ